MAQRRTRTYKSPVRAARARQTRKRILAAARSLFARQGYSATTLEQIAADAGVAVQTVYQAFGSKTRLLQAQLDMIDEIGNLPEMLRVFQNPASTPIEIARALARFLRRIFEGAGDIMDAARFAGHADPALQSIFVEGGMARHNAGVLRIVQRWAAEGQLRDALSVREAAAIVASIASHDLYHRLLHDWGWSPRRYEKWLADAIERLVLK